MRKLLIGMVVLAAMTLVPSAAKAQTDIYLQASGSTVTFASPGMTDTETATVNFNTTSGNATDSNTPAGNYTYTLSGGPVTLTETDTAPGPNYYTASNTALTVTIMGTGSTTGSLTGTVDLIDFQQFGNGHEGSTDTIMAANLTVTSATGSLAGYMDAGSGALQLQFHFSLTTPIDQLGSSGETVGIQNGKLTPSPEPRSMLLFGSGLLVFAGILRRQLRGGSQD